MKTVHYCATSQYSSALPLFQYKYVPTNVHLSVQTRRQRVHKYMTLVINCSELLLIVSYHYLLRLFIRPLYFRQTITNFYIYIFPSYTICMLISRFTYFFPTLSFYFFTLCLKFKLFLYELYWLTTCAWHRGSLYWHLCVYVGAERKGTKTLERIIDFGKHFDRQ